MKIKCQKGFTLVELACAMLTTSIVILAGGTALTTSQASLNRTWKKADLQRNASYAMLRISRHIKEGTAAEVGDDGKSIKIYKGADWMRFFLEHGSNDLKCEFKRQTVETIIHSVEDLKFDVDSNKVKINIILKNGDLETHFTSDVMIRNYVK